MTHGMYRTIFKRLKYASNRYGLKICSKWLNDFDSFKKWCDENFDNEKMFYYKNIKETICEDTLKMYTKCEIMGFAGYDRFDKKLHTRIIENKGHFTSRFSLNGVVYRNNFSHRELCHLHRNYILFINDSEIPMDKLDRKVFYSPEDHYFYIKEGFIRFKFYIEDPINVNEFLNKINNL